MVAKGRYGIGSYNLLQDNNRLNREHIISEVFDAGETWVVWVYVTPTLDATDKPLFRATCRSDKVVIEEAAVDTVYNQIMSFRADDERLADYRNGEVYLLHAEGKKVVVYEKSITYKGYYPIQVIEIAENGNRLNFYPGHGTLSKGDSNWVIQVTKMGTTSKESPEGTLMEIPQVRVETRGGYLKGLSEESFIIDTVLRYGKRSFLRTTTRFTEATVDSAGNPTYVEQVTPGEAVKAMFILGNFQVNLLTGG